MTSTFSGERIVSVRTFSETFSLDKVPVVGVFSVVSESVTSPANAGIENAAPAIARVIAVAEMPLYQFFLFIFLAIVHSPYR